MAAALLAWGLWEPEELGTVSPYSSGERAVTARERVRLPASRSNPCHVRPPFGPVAATPDTDPWGPGVQDAQGSPREPAARPDGPTTSPQGLAALCGGSQGGEE